MHTARLLTVSPRMHCAGGVSASGGCLLRGGCLLPGEAVCFPGGCLLLGGVSASGGGAACFQGVSQHALRQTPPVNRITDSCKNITFPQLRLRAVIKNTFKIQVIMTLKPNASANPSMGTRHVYFYQTHSKRIKISIIIYIFSA